MVPRVSCPGSFLSWRLKVFSLRQLLDRRADDAVLTLYSGRSLRNNAQTEG